MSVTEDLESCIYIWIILNAFLKPSDELLLVCPSNMQKEEEISQVTRFQMICGCVGQHQNYITCCKSVWEESVSPWEIPKAPV